MICFKDRTFCCAPNCKNECGRQWTDELQRQADEWWGGPGAPVAFSDFCSKEEGKETNVGKD
jgi:hypothetical protein